MTNYLMASHIFDMVNSSFEFIGSIANIPDLIRIRKDKRVKGVYWPARVFFVVWGSWNLLYYPSLQQWWSFYGGIAITLTNAIWIYHAIKFRKN